MANIIKWQDPFTGISDLHRQIDDMFNDFFGTSRMTIQRGNLPTMDIYSEEDKNLVTEIHAPGFNKDDFEISVHDGVLEVKGEKHEKEEDKDKDKRTYMMRESSASFYRRVALPKNADGDNVSAEFDNGVLKVKVPYKELPKPKRVQIASKAKGEKKA